MLSTTSFKNAEVILAEPGSTITFTFSMKPSSRPARSAAKKAGWLALTCSTMSGGALASSDGGRFGETLVQPGGTLNWKAANNSALCMWVFIPQQPKGRTGG